MSRERNNETGEGRETSGEDLPQHGRKKFSSHQINTCPSAVNHKVSKDRQCCGRHWRF